MYSVARDGGIWRVPGLPPCTLLGKKRPQGDFL